MIVLFQKNLRRYNCAFNIVFTLICILSTSGFARELKSNKFIINAGLNHTFFQYEKSANYFSNNFHIKPCLNLSFQHQISSCIGFSIGLDYSVLGGRKDFDFYDSVFHFDSATMTYQYVSTERFQGNYIFNFSYYSIPILITGKISNLPIEFALGPSFGLIGKEELEDSNRGTAVPENKRNQVHSRILSSVKYILPLKKIESSIGFIYSFELTKIQTVLSSRGIRNSNELRLNVSVAIP
jgi:hypothetical protein